MASLRLQVYVGRSATKGRSHLSDEPHSMGLFFIGPDGKPITSADLPPRDLLNLTSSQKSVVVAAVRHGLIRISEACERYHLSSDEYLHWHRSFAGEPGREHP